MQNKRRNLTTLNDTWFGGREVLQQMCEFSRCCTCANVQVHSGRALREIVRCRFVSDKNRLITMVIYFHFLRRPGRARSDGVLDDAKRFPRAPDDLSPIRAPTTITIGNTLSKYNMTTESPSLVSTRLMLLDSRRLGNASLSTVYPDGRVTSITAMLLSFPPRYLKRATNTLWISRDRHTVRRVYSPYTAVARQRRRGSTKG